MSGEGRTRRPERARSAPAPRATGGVVRLGLIPAPDTPERIAKELASELPDLLGSRVDGSVSWDVFVEVDPLTGTGKEAPEILDVCRDRREREGWDLAVCLTDLPVYRAGRLVAADVSACRGVAGLSLPALGAARTVPGFGRPPSGSSTNFTREQRRGNTALPPSEARGPDGLVGPFRRVDPPDEDMKEMDVDARFAASGVRGRFGLWSGMVLANRPWKMLPAFKGAIAAAFATGAYALVITTVWILADSVGSWRLLLLMATAIVAMVVWIIVAHHLWERPEEGRRWVPLYNGVTALSVSAAVLSAYAVLFALIFVAAWVFVPVTYFRTILKHPVGLGEYLTLAWLATSLATVAGALGASLEDEETVRNASYGYRQRRRHGNDEDAEGRSRGGLAER